MSKQASFSSLAVQFHYWKRAETGFTSAKAQDWGQDCVTPIAELETGMEMCSNQSALPPKLAGVREPAR